MDSFQGKIEPKEPAIINEIIVCNKCNTIESHLKFPLSAHGNSASRFMLIGEAPGIASIQNSKYWTGQGGQLLRTVFAEVTAEQLEEVFYLTDIIKCWPSNHGNNRKPKRTEIKNCAPFLKGEIEAIRPKVVILLGRVAYENARSILLPSEFNNRTIQTVHNSLIEHNGIIVIPLLHPSNVNLHMDIQLYKKQIKDVFDFVIKKQKREVYK